MAQKGFIFKKGGSWFLRYRDNVMEDGQVCRKQQCKRLAPVCDQYRTEKDLQGLRDEILMPINSGKVKPESTLTVAQFGEAYWLPWVRENCKPSTVAGYETTWRIYLAPNLQKITLRDFRTVDAAHLFVKIMQQHPKVGRTMIQHCKRRLSSLFGRALNEGALDTRNPIEGAEIPRKATAPKKTRVATPEEVLVILDLLEKAGEWKARAAVGLIFFAGLRPGEARGTLWENYDGKRLQVTHSVWHTHTTTPKTAEAANPVPVIDTLAGILAKVRELDGNPTTGPMLRGERKGKPLNLDNLSKRVIMPAMRLCKACHQSELIHAKADHPFELDPESPKWHGWYSLRRGVSTTLAGITGNALASKGPLRHTNLSTTTRNYVKDVPEITVSGMNKLDTLFNQCATRPPETVN